MARWMKVLAVALAAVVSVAPAFAQLSHAQAFHEPVLVVPAGDEVLDEELLEVQGELVWWVKLLLAELFIGLVAGGVTYVQTGDVLESALVGTAAMIIAAAGVYMGVVYAKAFPPIHFY